MMRDCVELAEELLNGDDLREFLAILWECWNVRNRFMFQKPDTNLGV